MKKWPLSFALLFAHFAISAEAANPHFYVQMENQTKQTVSLGFVPLGGVVSLSPAMASDTTLAPQQVSQKYGVVFKPLGRNDSFNMVFTGRQDCSFNVAFFAPGNPKITIAGPSCFGGGYRINGDTLTLFVSDMYFN